MEDLAPSDGAEAARYSRTPATLWRQYADEVVLAGEEGDLRILSGTGAAVWRLLVRPMTVAEMVEELSRRYRGAPGIVHDGVTSLLGELQGQGHVEEVEDSGG